MMLFLSYLTLALLLHCSSALGNNPKGTDPLAWSIIDADRIRLPYGINPIVPSKKGPFTPPKPLSVVPKILNELLLKTPYKKITTVVKHFTKADKEGKSVSSADSIQSILKSLNKNVKGIKKRKMTCDLCLSALQTLQLAAQKLSPTDVTTLIVDLCRDKHPLFHVKNCMEQYNGSASQGPHLAKLFYLMNNATQDHWAFCSFKGADCPKLPVVKIKETDWFSPKPKNSRAPLSSYNTLGVVHLSDIHLDSRYMLGSPTGCRTPGVAGTGNNRFGTYDCDSTPDLTLAANAAIGEVKPLDEIKWAIFTGDMVNPDDDLVMSQDYVMFEERNIFNAFQAQLKNAKGNIPVYASLGNHDSHPEMWANSDSSWNFDFLSDLWRKNKWIDADAAADVKKHFGAYAVSNPPGLKGLKVISLNTDFWYVANVFNYANYTNPDPNGMLSFLISELTASEKANQRVWIIGHVPSGYGNGNALPNPTALFQSVVVRFSPATIAAIFWGHTHWDQKMIYYDFAKGSWSGGARDTSKVDYSKPLNVGWIGPSVTPGAGPTHVNPAWSYYSVDDASYSIINAQTYSLDISEASWSWLNTTGKWKQFYDAREAYDLKNVSSKTEPLNATWWDTYLAQQITTNPQIAKAYFENELRGTSASLKCTSTACTQCTTTKCLKKQQCKIRAGTAEAATACQGNDKSPNGP